MPNNPVLVIGASRGIGAELVRQYLADGQMVHATVRDPAEPGELAGLDGDLVLHRLDVRDPDEITELAQSVDDLAVIIHNAGINRAPRAEIMEVNAVAPIRVVEALLAAGTLRPEGVIAIMTSQMGARRDKTGSLGDYGDSKEALNLEFRNRADDWRGRGALAIVVHPGWVRTDMGGSSAPLSVEESATGVRDLIANLTPEQHGRFWTWDGREHPW
ncbi:MAG: SDR family NAD(P)-dependent oxidoreductase [Acidimicrobiia bacterium]|nr:SDR family NAD(P)-dependent oxidoreductase [Acidimicrobiia bacterium]NNL97505.1 SDR family NAD(P)-dependent oxidoreductase [Acidimicrobiia bacterium]